MAHNPVRGIESSRGGLDSISEGCIMNTEFDDWTWRIWYVFVSVQRTAFAGVVVEAVEDLRERLPAQSN